MAIQSAPTLRNNIEIINWEISGGNPNGKLKVIAAPSNLHNVEPEKQNLDANAGELRELVLGYVATDLGIILQLIGTLQRKTARLVKVSIEFTSLLI